MRHLRWPVTAPGVLVCLLFGAALVAPPLSLAHPLGNFSIGHYAGLRLTREGIALRYVLDMAEIPAFLAIQETGIVPAVGHPSLRGYLDRQIGVLRDGLRVEVNGQRLLLQGASSEVVFPPGAGNLPTLRLEIVYRAPLEAPCVETPCHLHYRDSNFPGRLGWHEVIAVAAPGVTIVQSSVPARDRSRALTDYPADGLRHPPQVLEADVRFQYDRLPPVMATTNEPPPVSGPVLGPGAAMPTPRSAFTALVTTPHLTLGMVGLALAVAVGLGALHALEPGHGKTVVAAYLVGTRGTPRQALALGLIVTATHTAGVYLLGGVTLALSQYIVPERLYPWLGVLAGTLITGLGCGLWLRRYAEAPETHTQRHAHGHPHAHTHGLPHHQETVPHTHPWTDKVLHHAHTVKEPISRRALLALGITGGMIPCPAALVVLLSAIALHRVGFGLLLIVAFSVGLASVLMTLGLVMVSARHVLARFQGEGRLLTRWLPLTSAAVITMFGLVMIVQALVTAGLLQIRL